MGALLTRYLRRAGGLAILAAWGVAAYAFGFEVAWNLGAFVLVLALGYLLPLYVLAFRRTAAQRPAAIENGRLVQRTRSGRVTATIDLAAPFTAESVHQDIEWAIYRVRQGREVVKLTVPVDGDGALVRALGLPWPPPVPSPFRYL